MGHRVRVSVRVRVRVRVRVARHRADNAAAAPGRHSWYSRPVGKNSAPIATSAQTVLKKRNSVRLNE